LPERQIGAQSGEIADDNGIKLEVSVSIRFTTAYSQKLQNIVFRRNI
jgi:hypothetical protein